MYVSFCNSVLTCLAVMCIFVIYKCLSWDSNQLQDLDKPSQEKNSQAEQLMEAVKRMFHVVSEKIQFALRREQGWTHSLQCCQRQATQVRIKQGVIQWVVLMDDVITAEYVCSWLTPFLLSAGYKKNHASIGHMHLLYSWIQHSREHLLPPSLFCTFIQHFLLFHTLITPSCSWPCQVQE